MSGAVQLGKTESDAAHPCTAYLTTTTPRAFALARVVRDAKSHPARFSSGFGGAGAHRGASSAAPVGDVAAVGAAGVFAVSPHASPAAATVVATRSRHESLAIVLERRSDRRAAATPPCKVARRRGVPDAAMHKTSLSLLLSSIVVGSLASATTGCATAPRDAMYGQLEAGRTYEAVRLGDEWVKDHPERAHEVEEAREALWNGPRAGFATFFALCDTDIIGLKPWHTRPVVLP